jgi:hypothetical protein
MPSRAKRGRKAPPKAKPDSGVPIALKNLPSDPPTVSPSLKRDINIVLTKSAASGSLTLSFGDLSTAITAQCFGNTTAFYRYVIVSVKAWGAAGASSSLSLIDEVFGISSADSGTYSARPVVGLWQPPSTRSPRSKDVVGTYATIKTAPEDAEVTVHYNLILWSSASVDI